jgi:small-conductance mechanosensitive channel
VTSAISALSSARDGSTIVTHAVGLEQAGMPGAPIHGRAPHFCLGSRGGFALWYIRMNAALPTAPGARGDLHVEQWLTPDFWQKLYLDAAKWLLTTAPKILVILLIGLALLRILKYALRELHKFMMKHPGDPGTLPVELEKRVLTLTGVVRRSAHIFVWSLVGILILREMGLDIAPLIAGAGVAGLAVGFGAQNLVRDVISGFFLILENHVRAGDVATINGTSGLVESISLRTITLRDPSGVVHIFQNGNITTLANQTKLWSAMLFDIGISYGDDPDEAMQVMREVCEQMQQDAGFGAKILESIEILGVDAFTDSAVVVKARIKTSPGQQWIVGREYRRRLKAAFDARGIEFPYRQLSLNMGAENLPFRVQVESPAEPTRRARS